MANNRPQTLGDLPEYHFTALSHPRAFRLLRLHAGHGEEPLACRLFEVSLDDRPSYEPISYAWGDPDSSHVLRVNDGYLPISRNLAQALRRFREKDKDHVLWTDRVCINQQDDEEKNVQVRLMREFYENGTQTNIWLGADDKGLASDGLELMHELIQQYRREGGDEESMIGAIPELPKIDLAGHYGLPPSEDGRWLALRDICARPWFCRAWVIQEFSASPQALLTLGEHQFHFADLRMAISWLLSKNSIEVLGTDLSSPVNIIYLRNALLWSRWPLPEILQTMPFFQSSLLVDKVYAILGASREGLHLERHPLLRIDYRRPYVDVYRDAARYVAEAYGLGLDRKSTKGLFAMVGVGAALDASPLPSWVPRLDCPAHVRPHPYAPDYQTAGLIACGSLISQIAPQTADPNILSVMGLQVDVVAELHPDLVAGAGGGPSTSWEVLRRLWLRVRKHPRIEPPAGVLRERAFAAVVSSCGASPPWEDEHAFSSCWRACLADEARIRGESFDDATMGEEAPKAEPANLERGVRFLFLLVRKFLFFVTRGGRMGFGPPHLREGDAVCVLFGNVVPVTLRARPEAGPEGQELWTLMGECYVDGFMRGEAIEEMENGLLERRSFDIR